MLNDKEKQFKKEIQKLKNILSILPKNQKEELEKKLSLQFGLDFKQLIALDDTLDEIDDVESLHEDDMGLFDNVIEEPHGFCSCFQGDPDFYSEPKKEKPVAKESTKNDEISKSISQLNEDLSAIVNSDEFDSVLLSIAKSTHKLYMSYRVVGFTSEEALMLTAKGNSGIDGLMSQNTKELFEG